VSILKKLEREPYRSGNLLRETKERSIEEVTELIRERVLESHAQKVVEARMNRNKRHEITALVSELLVSDDIYVGRLTRRDLADRIVQEMCGLGPIDEFLDDAQVTEIMVNGPEEVFIERDGTLVKTEARFQSEGHVLDLINRVVGSVGRRVDKSSPYVDARLPDGSRINAVVPPLALNGPILTIRRFPERYSKLEELVSMGTLPASVADFLRICVDTRMDIVVSGGSGSGKTTTLNTLTNAVGHLERIVVIEDSSEIRVPGHHVVYLETRPENVEGKGLVSVRDLLRNALRMRPDRIVIGECRGKETFDLIATMNTGHEGCLSTVHANSSRDCLSRLAAMALMSDEMVPLGVLESWIGAALDIIVHQAKRPGGERVIAQVSLVGVDGGALRVHPVYDLDEAIGSAHMPDWFADKVGSDRAALLDDALRAVGK
jgi:pilus assembly protein CpaF